MLNVQIKESNWKEFNEVEALPETPYWFKQTNGNVVLAVHLTTKYSSGWAKCNVNNEGVIVASGNEFYTLKGAKLQCAWVKDEN